LSYVKKRNGSFTECTSPDGNGRVKLKSFEHGTRQVRDLIVVW